MFKEKEFLGTVLRINSLLNAKRVAEILNISKSTVYRFRQLGEIPTVRVGKSRRVQPEDLIKYIERNTYALNQFFE
jgi:excisionase family DNA binding protein